MWPTFENSKRVKQKNGKVCPSLYLSRHFSIVSEKMELNDGDIVGIIFEKIFVDEETKKGLKI